MSSKALSSQRIQSNKRIRGLNLHQHINPPHETGMIQPLKICSEIDLNGPYR